MQQDCEEVDCFFETTFGLKVNASFGESLEDSETGEFEFSISARGLGDPFDGTNADMLEEEGMGWALRSTVLRGSSMGNTGFGGVLEGS